MEIEDKDHAIVDYGDGTSRKVNISLIDAKIGDYVLIHAGFAIQSIDEKEAMATIDIFREMMEG